MLSYEKLLRKEHDLLTQEESLTADEIVDRLNIKKTTFYQAVRELQVEPSRPIEGDRRFLKYPPGTLEQVRQWVHSHRQ